jgi:disulfide bond formation protein DsbB
VDSAAARTICARIALRYIVIGVLLLLVALAIDPHPAARFLYLLAAMVYGAALGVTFTRQAFR